MKNMITLRPNRKIGYQSISADSAARLAVMVGVSCAPILAHAQQQAPLPTQKTSAARRPAQIYFGAYRNMDQLVAPDAQWDFVRQNMDGFIMHFGFWLNNDFKGDPIGVGKKLSAQLNPLGKKWMMEVGWPGGGMEDHFDDMGQWYGERHARQIQQFQRDTNIKTDEISCDFRLFGMQRVAAHFPDFDANDVYKQVTGDMANYPADGRAKASYWPNYIRKMKQELPATPIHVTFPPVYVPWDNFVGGGDAFNFTVKRTLPGESAPRNVRMKYEGRDFFESLFKEDVAGFIADSPYGIMTNPIYAKQGYIDKVLAMQEWLHGRGLQFSYIVIGEPAATLAPAAWDAKYKEISLKSLQLFQSVGGRADRYIFESWYRGPYQIVPETQEGTFTNLVMDAIKYLKGTGQKLDLAVKTPGAPAPVGVGVFQTQPSQAQKITVNLGAAPLSYEVQLINAGDVACMPLVRALEEGGSTNFIRYSVAGRDVTASVRSAEGHVFTEMIAPGASATLNVTLLPSSNRLLNKPATTLQAFWNPQDGGSVRDTISISAASK